MALTWSHRDGIGFHLHHGQRTSLPGNIGIDEEGYGVFSSGECNRYNGRMCRFVVHWAVAAIMSSQSVSVLTLYRRFSRRFAGRLSANRRLT